jgi:hypothetical protein
MKIAIVIECVHIKQVIKCPAVWAFLLHLKKEHQLKAVIGKAELVGEAVLN